MVSRLMGVCGAPKWDILPNTGVTKPGADRFPKGEGERIDER
jgi:hypothetical protein